MQVGEGRGVFPHEAEERVLGRKVDGAAGRRLRTREGRGGGDGAEVVEMERCGKNRFRGSLGPQVQCVLLWVCSFH